MTRSPLTLVVLILGLVLILAVVAISYLAATGHPIPDVLQNIAVGGLTGLVGVLVQPRNTPTPPGS